MAEFRMPSLGADMDAGTLVLWKVRPGDCVKRGDVIAEVETQKGIIEVECFDEGVVDQIIVQPGERVPVGTVMALIRADGAVVAPPITTPIAAPTKVAAAVVTAPAAAVTEKRVRVSPLARQRATGLGIDLSMVAPGPDGTINRAAVEHAAEAKKVAEKAVAPPVMETAPSPPSLTKPAVSDFQAGMRQAIAAAIARANREIPHYYLETQIDMSRVLRWLEAENLKRSIKDRILPVVLLIKAVAKALI